MGSSTIRRVIATLNVGGQSLHPASRASFEAAAARWEAELVIFTDPLAACHIWWQKTFVIEQLLDFDQVLQLDADMLIAADCPPPWTLSPGDRLGLCRDVQHRRQFRFLPWLHRQYEPWYQALRSPRLRLHQFLNAGLLLYSPARMLPWFRLWRAVGQAKQFPPWGLGDQGVLCLLAWRFGLPIRILSARWNQIHAGTNFRPDLPRRMRGTIYHFCGQPQTRAARIEATTWYQAETADRPHGVEAQSADPDKRA